MADKIRIAFFIDSLNCGGAERSLISLLQKLDYGRLDVDLYAWTRQGTFVSLKPRQVNLHTIPVSSGCVRALWHRLCQLRYSLLIRLMPMLHIKRHQAELLWRSIHTALPTVGVSYDVAVAYQQGFMTYYVADKVRASRKVAWINSQLSGHHHRVAFSRRYYDKYDDVVCVSDQLHDILSESGYVNPGRLSTIYDMLDVDNIRAMADNPVDLSVYGATPRTLIVTVARLTPPKNLPLAIQTAALLRDRGIDFRWIIVGGGVIINDLRQLIADNCLEGTVILAGLQPNPYPYIKAADIYVQTSSYEGYGLTIAEAKILHKPIVSTDFSVVHDQLEHGVNGLIASMTPQSVARHIMSLIEDEGLRHSLVANLSREINTTAQTEVSKFYRLIGLK